MPEAFRDAFFELTAHATRRLRGGEVLLAGFSGEQSDFVRFNHARVRQAMSVRQATLHLTLIDDRRRSDTSLTLTGRPADDREAVERAVRLMQDELPGLPEDPYLLYATEPATSERIERAHLPTPAEAIDAVVTSARDLDLVGFLASGPILRGFASSLGARHWHAVESFVFDWSLYQTEDRAVKCAWAGDRWDRSELARRIDGERERLALLAQPPKTIEPGEYRVLLAPAAVDEIVGMLNWSGFSAKAQRTKQSVLQRLVEGEVRLAEAVSIAEHTAAGLAPAFDAVGFTKPPRVELIHAGRHAGALVSPRSAKEYGLTANGASGHEGMQSAELAPGTLPAAGALAALDTGIWISNLWYLNFSDRSACRLTGMTRFATFWVENGRVVAPLAVMRFDDTVYRMLGDALVALTRETDWIPSVDTYDERSTGSSRVPGALVARMRFTL